MKMLRTASLSILLVGALLVPAISHAQDATLSGTVTDSTGAVLPGATVTALHEASGNTFFVVTDAQGVYRMPVRIGVYRVTAELSGFATVSRTGVQLLVGQQATLNLQMAPSGVQESVTVTGEAPLLDVTTSTVSANIDARQVQELPLNGRNWLDLTLLAPGNRANHGGETPIPRGSLAFQINVEGQQVKNSVAGPGFGQPRFSRDAIAEFEFISNRFDATQGRSMGVVVNAVTKSGTNTPSGTFSGYFRDDRFNAADFIQDRVLPYSNQQLSTTYGGPIRRDRIHIFANYEFEREPQTFTYDSPYPFFNIDLNVTRTQHTGGGKVDVQFTPQARLATRITSYTQFIPGRQAGGSNHPSTASEMWRYSNQVWSTFTQVLSSRMLNEVKGGYYDYHWKIQSLVRSGGLQIPGAPFVTDRGSYRILLRGYTLGNPTNLPQVNQQDTLQIRDDFSTSFNAKGRHDVRLGGEFLKHLFRLDWCSRCIGELDARGGPAPGAAALQAMFPVWNDASTWNLQPLSPLSVRFRQAVGDFIIRTPRELYAAWVQDDWMMSNRLTLNLGLRYDADIGVMGEKIELLPWLSGDRPSDLNNFQPRVGFAYRLGDQTVMRGVYGMFFTQLENDAAHQPTLNRQTIIPEVPYDGRADFAVNPFNGPAPTHAAVSRTLCATANVPGCVRREIAQEIPTPGYEISYSHMASIGVQRQLGSDMVVETNYVYTGSRAEEGARNMNLTWDPVTRANFPSRDISRRPYPEWGFVNGEFMRGYANSHGLETSFTKRFSDRWQLMGTYTLSWVRDSEGQPCQIERTADGSPTCSELSFTVAPDIADYTLAATDQRHRAVVNGIWEVGYGLQLSGLYFYGSGMRFATNVGTDRREVGSGSGRLRADGSIMPRNALVGEPLHRVDLRIQRRFALFGRSYVDGMAEVFNLFNHENYGSYTIDESSRAYGNPSFNENVAYQPRMLQLGFRFAF